jgi:hypothetical protein
MVICSAGSDVVVATRLAGLPPGKSPGEGWKINNLNVLLARLLVETYRSSVPRSRQVRI